MTNLTCGLLIIDDQEIERCCFQFCQKLETDVVGTEALSIGIGMCTFYFFVYLLGVARKASGGLARTRVPIFIIQSKNERYLKNQENMPLDSTVALKIQLMFNALVEQLY